MATNHVGDFVSYNVILPGIEAVNTSSVTAESSADYTVETVTQVGSSRNVTKESVNKDEIFSHEFYNMFIENCETNIKGKLVNLMVLGREMLTCKLVGTSLLPFASLINQNPLTIDANTVGWFGDIPVNGLVQFQSDKFRASLRTYNWAE